jgi:hypothetical protein
MMGILLNPVNGQCSANMKTRETQEYGCTRVDVWIYMRVNYYLTV